MDTKEQKRQIQEAEKIRAAMEKQAQQELEQHIAEQSAALMCLAGTAFCLRGVK